ncbi:type II toxin-antitoxin system antitoxin DNA ADP-ribosyl glycohydrolase DarG [Vibrio vulnificus]|uniref:type II toxin-antitoxin system antitoxin DNA ADP-ribosyl glycohydrolase DarG n=1 Tax=Vibrio vulnificus TaxID=672 RepID=UPI001029F3E6|nr:macro domain-containing protein [Vibrio vulnificus]EGQ8704446.1 ADP-ribose-binding protein [Vibrio parahaemolyticus]EGR3460815.1 ADP-ribose-binding protein [Vibrio parahaemolyticus]EJC7183350.1 macro domain-containing protein [Vibrio parahaemolyticus]EJG0060759.1 macro domain-containing protein [Vibrio parahaemolyticus]EJG0451305.1 macro domain-containing protein [Vibrio parahaemolyticus]
MITYKKGDLFADDAEALINTVNTVGVMGKGLAYQFKERYPYNFKIYRDACKNEDLSVGKVLLVENPAEDSPRYIINFPTKAHWRGKSKIEYIEDGLDDLVRVVLDKGIKSVAIPALGSGLGGLPWSQVERKIYDKLSPLDEVEWRVYAPNDAPPKNKSLELTLGRATLIVALKKYLASSRKKQMSELEAQCLLYMLSCNGIELNKMEFNEFKQVPYSPVLSSAIRTMDGDFLYISGINKPADSTFITLEPKVASTAERMLRESEANRKSISNVIDLVAGYESKDGMIILASTLWSARKMSGDSKEVFAESLVENVLSLISPQARVSPTLIKSAYQRLIEEGQFI